MNEAQRKLWKEKYGKISVGYVLDYKPNAEFEEMGLVCRYEHCIEMAPFFPWSDEKSCPVFGHDCPATASDSSDTLDREACEKLCDLSDKELGLIEDIDSMRDRYIELEKKAKTKEEGDCFVNGVCFGIAARFLLTGEKK